MTKFMEAELDEKGMIHALEPGQELPTGRVRIVWESSPDYTGIVMSERSLAKDWLRPEEDEAWDYLQRAK